MENPISYNISSNIGGNGTSIIDIILIINCFLLTGLILIQNESSRDTLGIQTNFSTPIENWTTFLLGLLFCLFLLKIKFFA